jgi:uncharacterized membrane protein HdeD (DUF308 family)
MRSRMARATGEETMAHVSSGASLGDKIAAVRAKWGWFVAAGIALVVFGVIAFANLFAATLATVFVTGVMLIIAGIVQIGHSFGAKSWGNLIYWLLSGILYAAAGVIAIADPLLASAVFTLLLAAALFAVGALRIIAGFDARPTQGWGWIVAGGVLTLLLGVLIAIGWPLNTVWLIGLVLAVDLVSQGVAWIGFGLGIRPRA